MGFAIAAVVAAGVVAAGTIASDEVKKGALGKATQTQLDALDSIKGADIPATQALAAQADKDKLSGSLAAQKSIDPTTAALRETGASNLLAGLTPGSDESSLLSELQKEGLSDTPNRQAILDKLYQGAQDELNSGATLDPSFQAELVRSGLERTGQAGVSADYKGAAGVEQRQLLGAAGLQLKQQRIQNAGNLLTLADTFKNNRAAILANTLGQTENVKAAQQNRNAQGFSIGQSTVPNIGIGGSDVANLSISNLNQANNVKMQRAQAIASGELGKAALTGNEITTGAGFVSSAVGGMGGGGGSGGMISGLMGGGGGQAGQAVQANGYQLPTNWATLPYSTQRQYATTLSSNNAAASGYNYDYGF